MIRQELQKECLRVLKASDNIGTPRETGSGFFEAGAYLPDVGSISLSFPRIRAPFAVDAGVPCRAVGLRGRQVGRKGLPERPR